MNYLHFPAFNYFLLPLFPLILQGFLAMLRLISFYMKNEAIKFGISLGIYVVVYVIVRSLIRMVQNKRCTE